MLPVSLVIPTLNEVDNIIPVLASVDTAQIIVVDGGSTDGTVDRIKEAGYGDMVDIIVDYTPGKGHAMRRGFEIATQPYVIMIDADGSMDPDEMHVIVDQLSQGWDMVKGSRSKGFSHDLTWFRALGNFFLTVLFNMLYDTEFTDLCYGYMAFQREALLRMDLNSTGFEIESELVATAVKMGMDIIEFPSVEMPRLFGKSNLSPIRDGLRVLSTILKHR